MNGLQWRKKLSVFCRRVLAVSLLIFSTSGLVHAADVDFDGIDDSSDNCQNLMNPLQKNHDGDAYGNLCEPGAGNVDTDGDGIHNAVDNCVNVPNPEQKDWPDGDGIGNLCEPGNGQPDGDGDLAGDGAGGEDNCPGAANPLQRDLDGDGVGTVCDGDENVYSNYSRVLFFENSAIKTLARMVTTEASSYAAYLRAIDYETRTIESIIRQRNDDGPITTCGCHGSEVPDVRRQILGESGDFNQPSHHIVGSPEALQCLACHYTGDHRQGVVKLLSPDDPTQLYEYDPENPGAISDFCLACHDADGARSGFWLTPFRDGETVPDIKSDHYGTNCVTCHYSTTGLNAHVPGHGAAGGGCESCHGHDADYEYESGKFSLGTGTTHSHSTHTENDSDDWRGPNVGCETCHDTNNFPAFADDELSLEKTAVCDTCHSPEGSYDGVDDPDIGVKYGNGGELKYNWVNGIYQVTGEKLKSDKEIWCATCHDEEPSVIFDIPAPKVIGDEGAVTNYGVGYGFYKSGHGLALTETYPGTGGTVAGTGITCGYCHDTGMMHIDGVARTYDYDALIGEDNDYQHGYRLISVGGELPLALPRLNDCLETNVVKTEDFRLCFRCHDSEPFTDSGSMDTNFRNDSTAVNAHNYHLGFKDPCGSGPHFTSDWDASHVYDSRISCVTCHNVHGSSQLAMVREGNLVNRSPGLEVVYDNGAVSFNCLNYPDPANVSRAESTGTIWRPNQVLCGACHGSCGLDGQYLREPFDNKPPRITRVEGTVGSDQLQVQFSEGVYHDLGAMGSLLSTDLDLSDVDALRSISTLAHTAGDNTAIVVLDLPYDGIYHFGVDTLAAATANSIFDGNDQAMDTTPVLISDGGPDSTSPVISDLSPANNDIDVDVDSYLMFTLTDSGGGVNWNTLEIELTDSLGYSQVYTDEDFDWWTKAGTPAQYQVTLDPMTSFSCDEQITVVVKVDDLAGNSLAPVNWAFTTGSEPIGQTMILHPSGVVSDGGGTFIANGGGWAEILDSDDGDATYVSKCCDGSPVDPYFTVAMDDTGLGPTTIQDFTIHVVARYVATGGPSPKPSQLGNIDIGYKTGSGTIWNGSIQLAAVDYDFDHVVSQIFTFDSDAGPLDLADIENMEVTVTYITRVFTLLVTEVYVEVNYYQ